MPFQKGHKVNLGSDKVGRKTIEQELEAVKDKIREEVTQEMLVKVANRVVYKQLVKADENENAAGAKEFAMPVALKGMTDKKDITSKGESLSNQLTDEEFQLLLNAYAKNK